MDGSERVERSAEDAGGPSTLDRDAPAPALDPENVRTATFGAGCFWGPEAHFGAMEGVVRTRVGYAGGTKPDPSYYALGDHTEVVQLEYDPETVSYEDLLDVFWGAHDWTSQPKRQYRSLVLTHDEDQREAVERRRTALEERTGRSVATAVEPLDSFTLAEDFHQKYELQSTPVLGDELRELYGEAFVDSTVAARLNGFVAGHGDDDRRRELLAALDLPPPVLAEVHRRL